MSITEQRLKDYQLQMSIYAEQHKMLLASDVLDMIEQLQDDLKDDVDSVVEQIKTLSPANYVSKDDVLKIVKGDNFSPNNEKNSFFDFDEVVQRECEKARSKAIDDFVAEFKNKDSELRKSCNNWYEFTDRIAEQLKKEVEE